MENDEYTLTKIETATGWVRPTSENAVNETAFVYDFYVTDHLGNIRVVVTEESFIEIAVATLEPEHLEDEISVFDGVISPNTTTPSGWPISTDINHVVSKLSSGGHVVGPSRLVSVKRSDALSVEVESYYTEDEGLTTGQSMAQILTGLLLGLGAQAPGIIPSGEQGMDVFANPASAQSVQLFDFLSNTQTMDDLQRPRSYLVYLFFDKNMMLDGHYSGIIQVGNASQLNILQQHLSAMQRDGYFYTYVTNQSERRVYYNNLTLVHKRGNIVQSNDYYPFGLTWENPRDDMHTYQGKELQRNEWSSGGLEMLDFHARMYNPLIGRWHNPDPMNQFDSPYNAMGNNPVINIDPDGMWSLPWGGILTGLSFTQIGYIANPRTMLNDPYMTRLGGMLQVAGAAFSFWEGGKMLRDGQFNLGSSANTEPRWSRITRSDGSFQGNLFWMTGNSGNQINNGTIVNTEMFLVYSMMALQELHKVEMTAYLIQDPLTNNYGYFIQDWLTSQSTETSSSQIPEVTLKAPNSFSKETSSIAINGRLFKIFAILHTHPNKVYIDGAPREFSNTPSSADGFVAGNGGVPNYILGPDYISRVSGRDAGDITLNTMPEHNEQTGAATKFVPSFYKIADYHEVNTGSFKFVMDATERKNRRKIKGK